MKRRVKKGFMAITGHNLTRNYTMIIVIMLKQNKCYCKIQKAPQKQEISNIKTFKMQLHERAC